MSNLTVVRYSDGELEEFRELILDRLKKAQEELDDLRSQILDITESLEGDFGNDYMDDSSVASDLEMLNNMAIRKRKYIQDLENALIRIKNKTYGICTMTGELIDKKRLLAVPTTTKSLQGKAMEQSPTRPVSSKDEDDDDTEKTVRPSPSASTSKIITRVIRKSGSAGGKSAVVDEEEEEDFGAGDDFMPDLKRIDAADVADDLEDDTSDADDDYDDFADDRPDEGDDDEDDSDD